MWDGYSDYDLYDLGYKPGEVIDICPQCGSNPEDHVYFPSMIPESVNVYA
jgi:hypothetical protein